MSGRETAIFVGAPLTNNTCQQSPISKTRPDRDIMLNREDMILTVNSQQSTVNNNSGATGINITSEIA